MRAHWYIEPENLFSMARNICSYGEPAIAIPVSCLPAIETTSLKTTNGHRLR